MKRIEHILFILIFILSIFLGLYKSKQPVADWHSWRQSDTSAVSRIFYHEGFDLLYPRYYDISSAQTGVDNPNGYRFVEFPIYNALQVFVFDVIEAVDYDGNSIEFSGRLVSILASSISLLFIYKIGKHYMNWWGGLIAAFFFATLPFNVYYSRAILPEPLAVMFMLASLWFFIRYITRDNVSDVLISSILFSLSIMVKPFTIFYGIPMLYLSYKKSSSISSMLRDNKLWMFLLIALIPFVTWRVWINQFPEGIPHMKWAFNSDGIRFRPSFWRWILGERLGVLILGIGGFFPFVIGLLNEFGVKTKDKFMLVMVFGMFTFVSVFATASVRHDYYQIILVPSVVLLLASGIVWAINQRVFNRLATVGVTLFCVFLMYVVSWSEIRGYYQINNYSIVKAGEAVDGTIPLESKVIAPYNKDTAFLYQTNRYGWPFLDGDIELLIQKGAEYYVSVAYDPVTIEIMKSYEVVQQTSEYVIVKLTN